MSCTLESSHLQRDPGATREFTPQEADSFRDNLKLFFIGFLVFPSIRINQRCYT